MLAQKPSVNVTFCPTNFAKEAPPMLCSPRSGDFSARKTDTEKKREAVDGSKGFSLLLESLSVRNWRVSYVVSSVA